MRVQNLSHPVRARETLALSCCAVVLVALIGRIRRARSLARETTGFVVSALTLSKIALLGRPITYHFTIPVPKESRYGHITVNVEHCPAWHAIFVLNRFKRYIACGSLQRAPTQPRPSTTSNPEGHRPYRLQSKVCVRVHCTSALHDERSSISRHPGHAHDGTCGAASRSLQPMQGRGDAAPRSITSTTGYRIVRSSETG